MMNDGTNLPTTFAYHPRLAAEFGPTVGILASYLIAKGAYSYEVETTFAQIASDTGLSIKNIETAKAKMVAANALKIRAKRIEHRTFYLLNMMEIGHLIDEPL